MSPAEIALLVTAVLGPTGIWGVKEIMGRKKARAQPITQKDLPGQDILNLEAKVAALTGLIGELASRVDLLERERDQAQRSRDEAVLRSDLAVAYTKTLRDHIIKELPPPPPDWPVGWIHTLEERP